MNSIYITYKWWGVEKAHRTRRGGDFRAAEGHRVIEVLCRPVDPASLRAVEGHFLSVHGEKVLPKEDAKMFELIAGPPQHGVVPKQGMGRLLPILQIGLEEKGRAEKQAEPEHRAHGFSILP